MSYLEVRRCLDKPDERYTCELIRKADGYALVRYVHEGPGKVGDVGFEVGSTTYAWYRTGYGYVAWEMRGPDGALKGHLFHVCRDQEVRDAEVEYLDLLLDLWFDPDGQLTVLDREDVETFRSNGMLTESDVEWISVQEREIVAKRDEILFELDGLLGKVGRRRTTDRT